MSQGSVAWTEVAVTLTTENYNDNPNYGYRGCSHTDTRRATASHVNHHSGWIGAKWVQNRLGKGKRKTKTKCRVLCDVPRPLPSG
jgi:hypothetical protein